MRIAGDGHGRALPGGMHLESAALLLAVAGLCGYLLAALVRPEKF